MATLKPADMYRELKKTEPRFSLDDYKRMYEVFADYVVNQLLENAEVNLPLLGKMVATKRKGKVRHIPVGTESSDFVEKWVEPYIAITFRPSEIFKQNLNNDRPTRLQIKRRNARYRAEMRTELTDEEAKEYVLKQMESLKIAKEKRLMRLKKNQDGKILEEELESRQDDDSELYEDFGELEI